LPVEDPEALLERPGQLEVVVETQELIMGETGLLHENPLRPANRAPPDPLLLVTGQKGFVNGEETDPNDQIPSPHEGRPSLGHWSFAIGNFAG
jgi:hypothetical protein